MIRWLAAWGTRRFVPIWTRVSAWRKARSWISNADADLRTQYADLAGFEDRLYRRWQNGLDGLQLLWLKAYDEGRAYNERQRPGAAADSDFVFDALARLHARACRAASEAIALLRTGHADGAYARWRTLHEIAVTMFFISRRGNDVAEAYLLHEGTRAWVAAEQYQRYHRDLGYKPLPDAELSALEARHRALVARFGAGYGSDYGWAAKTLGTKRPRFVDIEEATKMDRWRPRYRMASEGLHAGSRALKFTLGLRRGEDLLLAGPSDAGLQDPGVCTALSLAQATVALLTSRPEVSALVGALAIQRLAREVEGDFNEAATMHGGGA
jgi:hypothetical protein